MLPDEYSYVLSPDVYPYSGGILPDAHYYFLRRMNGVLIQCLVGRIDNENTIIHVDLTTGFARCYRLNREQRSVLFISLPLKVRETSIVSEMSVKDYFEHFKFSTCNNNSQNIRMSNPQNVGDTVGQFNIGPESLRNPPTKDELLERKRKRNCC